MMPSSVAVAVAPRGAARAFLVHAAALVHLLRVLLRLRPLPLKEGHDHHQQQLLLPFATMVPSPHGWLLQPCSGAPISPVQVQETSSAPPRWPR